MHTDNESEHSLLQVEGRWPVVTWQLVWIRDKLSIPRFKYISSKYLPLDLSAVIVGTATVRFLDYYFYYCKCCHYPLPQSVVPDVNGYIRRIIFGFLALILNKSLIPTLFYSYIIKTNRSRSTANLIWLSISVPNVQGVTRTRRRHRECV